MSQITVNEIPENLSEQIAANRYHVVYTDRKMFVAGQTWAEGYDLSNSWIFSTNDPDQAFRGASYHYVRNTAKAEEYGIDQPVKVVDTQTGTYVIIPDDYILKAYQEDKAYEGWLNLLKLLDEDENMALWDILDRAAEKQANQDIRNELSDIVAELAYVHIPGI